MVVDRVSHFSTNSSIELELSRGNHSFVAEALGFTAHPGGGTISVDDAPTSLAVAFSENFYNVSLISSGLPAGAAWSATLANRTVTSFDPVINFSLPDGNYSFGLHLVQVYIHPNCTICGPNSTWEAGRFFLPDSTVMNLSIRGAPAILVVEFAVALEFNMSTTVRYLNPTTSAVYVGFTFHHLTLVNVTFESSRPNCPPNCTGLNDSLYVMTHAQFVIAESNGSIRDFYLKTGNEVSGKVSLLFEPATWYFVIAGPGVRQSFVWSWDFALPGIPILW